MRNLNEKTKVIGKPVLYIIGKPVSYVIGKLLRCIIDKPVCYIIEQLHYWQTCVLRYETLTKSFTRIIETP